VLLTAKGLEAEVVDEQVTLDFKPLQNRFNPDALQCIFRAPAA